MATQLLVCTKPQHVHVVHKKTFVITCTHAIFGTWFCPLGILLPHSHFWFHLHTQSPFQSNTGTPTYLHKGDWWAVDLVENSNLLVLSSTIVHMNHWRLILSTILCRGTQWIDSYYSSEPSCDLTKDLYNQLQMAFAATTKWRRLTATL